MKHSHINLIRDAAIALEDVNLEMARDLMELAHQERPEGTGIINKLKYYNRKLRPLTDNEKIIKNLLDSGELVLIPAGIRCYTKSILFKCFGLEQASLPFDSGFFTPDSIANILESGTINLEYPDPNNTHKVCIKHEDCYDSELGNGISFKSSAYEYINEQAKNREQPDINKFLDSTFGYYTLDVKNQFVLAHYNWHVFANESKSQGVYDTKANILKINDILNKRINRLFTMCEKAKYIFFTVGEFHSYKYMSIDEVCYDLTDFKRLSAVSNKLFSGKCVVEKITDIDTADKLLKKINLDFYEMKLND